MYFAYKGLISGGGVSVHDQLLDRPTAFQRFFQILRDHPILCAGNHQKLVDVAAHTPHLPDQRGHIGRRGLLDLRAVQDMTAIALTGKTGSPCFSVQSIKLFSVFFSKKSSFLSGGHGGMAPVKLNCGPIIRCLLGQYRS